MLGVSEEEVDVSAIAQVRVEMPNISTYVKVKYCSTTGIAKLDYFFIAAKEKCLGFDYGISDS